MKAVIRGFPLPSNSSVQWLFNDQQIYTSDSSHPAWFRRFVVCKQKKYAAIMTCGLRVDIIELAMLQSPGNPKFTVVASNGDSEGEGSVELEANSLREQQLGKCSP